MSVSEGKATQQRPDARVIMEQLRPIAARMEAIRQTMIAKRKRAKTVAFSIATITAIFGVLVMLSGENQFALGVIFTVVGGALSLLVYWIIAGGSKNEYRGRFKTELLGKAVNLATPGIEYFPDSMVPKESFKAGGLFKSRIDRYKGEDCFRGKFGATELIFSELDVEREDTSTDSDGETSSTWVTVFKGIYLIADFHKDFHARVLIEPDVAEARFGWIGRKLQGVTGNLVRLENPEFEKAFKVTASDALAARYLLTPDMQERFLDLRANWAPDIRAVLVDSALHLAIPRKEDWFEPDFSAPADDIAALHVFLTQLTMILGITDTLDLNTRLWTKD